MTQKQPSQTTSVLLFININLMRERFLTFEVRRMLGLRRLCFHLVSLESVAEGVIRPSNSFQDTCHFQGSTANRLLPVVLVSSLQDNLLRVCGYGAATFSCEFEPKLTVRSDGAGKITDCIGNPGHLEMNKVIFQLRNGIKLMRMILICRSSRTIDQGVFMSTTFKLVAMDSRSEGVTALLPLQASRVVPSLPFTCGDTEEGVRDYRQFLRLLALRDKKSREIEFQNCPVQRIEFQNLNNARNSGRTTMDRFQGFLHLPDGDVSTGQKLHGLMVSPKGLHTRVDEINFSETSPLSAIVGFNTGACTIHCKAQVAVAVKEKKKWKGGVMQADDKISLGVHDFKGAWLRAVTLMLQFWQTDSCVSREVPTFCRKRKRKNEIICLKNGVSQNSIDINRFVNKSTCCGSQLERDHAVADVHQAKMLKSLKDDAVVINLLQDCHKSRDDSSVCAVNVTEARERCCGQEVLPGAVQVIHSEAGQSGLVSPQHHQHSNSVNSDENDFDEEAEDFDDESVLDSLEIEDEDQLDMILQDVQDDLQHANNDLIANEVPFAAWLPDIGQGYQVFPVPHDEVPEGHGVPQNLLNDVQMEQQAPEGEEDAGENEVGDNFFQGQNVVNGNVIVPWMQAQNGNQVHDGEVPWGQEPMHNQNAALMVLEIPANAPQAQGPQENAGPQDEAPQHFPIQQQHLNAVPNVNENGAQNDVPDADGADEHLAVQAPPPPPPPPHLPPHEEHPPQQVQANRSLNRLRAVARYIKRRFTWNRHGNTHHGNPLYVPGAPREERAPLGLEEAPALPGDQLIQNGVQRVGCFSACFGFLSRSRRSASVQVYPQHSEQAPEFEEAAPMPHEVDEEIEEEDEEADAEPLEAVEEIPQQNIVLIF